MRAVLAHNDRRVAAAWSVVPSVAGGDARVVHTTRRDVTTNRNDNTSRSATWSPAGDFDV